MAKKTVLWDLDVQVVHESTGLPLAGVVVEAWDKDYVNTKNVNDLLWVATTDEKGKCRGSFGKERFQDVARRHFDNHRPDVYFVVRDLLGNQLLATEVHSNLKAQLHAYTLRVNPKARGQLSPQRVHKRDWTILGELSNLAKGSRCVVECYDKDTYNQYGEDDWIFTCTTDFKGKFEQTFYEWDFRYKLGEKERGPDLYFVVKDLKGQIIYISDVFPNLYRDSVYYWKADLKAQSSQLVSLLKSLTTINWSLRIKNPQVISFPLLLNSFIKFLRTANVRLITPLPVKRPFLGIRFPVIFLPNRQVKKRWDFDVSVRHAGTNKPLIGVQVECWDKDYSKKKAWNDLLWKDTTDHNGKAVGSCTTFDFQNSALSHKDGGKPDVYFVVRDRKGNFLHSSKVHTNLDPKLRKFTLKVDPKPKQLTTPRSKSKAVWRIHGHVSSLPGSGPFVVEGYDKDNLKSYGPDDLLFKETTGANGEFQQSFLKKHFSYKPGESESEPDLFFVIKDLKGQTLYVSNVFSNLTRNQKDKAYYFTIDLALGQTSQTIVHIITGPGTPPPATGSNQPPTIRITPPTGALIQGESVEINYTLFDADSDTLHIEASYSTDGGNTFTPATEAVHPASEGTSQLSSSPAGEPHRFIWKAKDDLPSLPAADLIFKIQSFDAQTGGSDSTARFTVGSTVSNHAPTVSILFPTASSQQASVVEIKYTLTDDNSDKIRIEPTYSTDGGLTFKTASEAFGFGSEGLNNLSSSPAGDTHSFFWNAQADFPSIPATDVIFQIQSYDSGLGGVDSVGPFEVTDNLPPMIQIFSPAPGSQKGAPVDIQYVINDRDNDMARVETFYSIDGGKTFLPATSASSGDGNNNIQASDMGEVKSFMWDAVKDIQQPTQNDVIFRMQAFDAHPGGIEVTQPFDVTMPLAPVVSIINPNKGLWGTPLPVNYVLSHPSGNQLLTVELEYSLDQGQSYHPATEAGHLGSEGLIDLTASPQGDKHFFAWDVLTDIPDAGKQNQKELRLRVRAYKGSEMGEKESELFDIDAGYIGILSNPQSSGAPIKRPRIHGFDPVDHTGIHVPLRFILKHEDSARVNVRIEYSVNGQEYRPCAAARYSDQLTNLAAPEVNAAYRFIWDASHDLGQQGLTGGSVTLRATPYIGADDGLAYVTKSFSVTIQQPSMPQKVPPKTPLNTLQLIVIEGDGQEVIPGRLPPKNLTLEVRDAKNEILRGVRVTFSVAKDSKVDASFEPHPYYRSTTDYYGRTGIRVRPEEGKEGNLKILAHVVGVPGVFAVFSLNAKLPKIIPVKNNPKPPFAYGTNYAFYFYLDSELDINQEDFLYDEYDPVEFQVSTINAEANLSKIRLPGPGTGYRRNMIRVDLTPSYMGGTSQLPGTETFTLKVEALKLPGVAPYENRFSVQTENNAQHLEGVRVHGNGFGPRELVFKDVRLRLKDLSGHDPNDPAKKSPQKAYPGLTLSTPFQVEVVDENNPADTTGYTQSIQQGQLVDQFGLCDQIPMGSPENLKITWTAYGGVISTSASKGTKSSLDLEPSKKVYFTPTGDGPWAVTANFQGYVYDKNFAKHPYTIKRQTGTSSSGTIVRDPYCASQPGFYVNINRTFYIQTPDSFGFEDIKKASSSKPCPYLKQVKAGMKIRLLVQGLSPFTAGSSPKEVEVKCVKKDGTDAPSYTNSTLKFKQNIALKRNTQIKDILRSGEILILQNENKTSSGIPMAMLPLSTLRAKVVNLKFAIKTAGLKRQRLRFGAASLKGDTEFSQESTVQTSPKGAVLNTVTLHNGEFVYKNCDLSFPSREEELSVCRSYRSQVQSLMDPKDETEAIEPFGPGWFFDAGVHLEVGEKHLRFWDSTGAYHDYPFQRAGKGQFIFITLNDTISKTQSAYEIRDRHRNYYHFNIDGTLRFYIDRFNNKFEYEYNEKAQLVKIKDCLLPDVRQYTISYHEETTANNTNKWTGKIKEIIDFDNRKVSYLYYKKDEKNSAGKQVGDAGFLKKVTFPSCETVFENTDTAKMFRNYESYEYEKSTALGWRLKKVIGLDSKGEEQTLLTNHYDANGRVIKQEEGKLSFAINVLGPGKIEYKDKSQHSSIFTFPASPYWDSTAPEKLVDAENITHTMKHNQHGFLTSISLPKSGKVEYIYDEDSPYARRRADLLAEIKTSEKGQERITTYTHSGRYHFLLTTVGPEGNLPGVDPALHTFVNNYDHQRSNGDAGNVLDSHGPRTLNMVYKPLASGKRQPTWIEENQGHVYTYNSFGQLTSHIDERGIKTTYAYYAAGNPTEGSIGTAGGGFLAQIKEDTEATPKRDLHLPGDDAKPQTKTTTYLYNKLGYLIESFDQDGIHNKYTRNKLGEVIKTEFGPGVKGLKIVSETHLGPNGEVVRIKHQQPGNQQSVEEYRYSSHGFVDSRSTQVNSGTKITESFKRDDNDRVKEASNSLTKVTKKYEYDKNDRDTKTTVVSGGVTLETVKHYSANGQLEKITAPSGEEILYGQNDFGEIVKITEPTSLVNESLLNEAGIPVVELRRAPGGKVTAASEHVVDEYQRITRSQHMITNPNAKASGGKLEKTPENLGIGDHSYLPSRGQTLGDGRDVQDRVYDIVGHLVREVDGELGEVYSRIDARGRKVETDNKNGIRMNTSYDDAAFSQESTHTAESNNPLYPESHTFTMTSQFSKGGLLESQHDEHNRRMVYETNEAGQLTGITNRENAKVILKYDSNNNVEESETTVFVSGSHQDPKLEESISLYNSSKKILRRCHYDNRNRLVSIKNMAGGEYKYVYKDNLLKEIIYPAAQSSGGQAPREIFSYDTAARLESHTDIDGIVTTYHYEGDRLARVTTGQEQTTLNYDGVGYLVGLVDKSDASRNLSFERHSLGRVVKETQSVNGQSKTTEHVYDDTGRLTKTIYSPTEFVEYVYDNKTGQLQETRDQNGTISSYSYFANQVKQESTDGLNTVYEFSQGLLSGREISGLDNGDLRSDYDFDNMDRLIEEVITFQGQEVSKRKYTYDSLGRVLKDELISPHLPQVLVNRYYYDGDDNVVKEERDEFEPATGKIIRVTTEYQIDKAGLVVGFREDRTEIHSGSTLPPITGVQV